LNIQVEVTKEFRQNSLGLINAYVDSQQAELRDKIKQAKSEEEKTELYKEIYKLQYQRCLLETVVNILAADPTAAITQGTLQLAATKLREESLANSRQSPGIVIDSKTEEVINNVSYDSGYFDGVKLGGVRLNLDVICGADNSRCKKDNMGNLQKDANGNYIYEGDDKYPTFADLMKDKKAVGGMFGATGGFQPVKGGWYLPGLTIPYEKGSISDKLVESFAGTHDYIGGQMWGWYGDDGNTSRNRNKFQNAASSTTTVVAIPASAPAALADFLNSDIFQLLNKLGK
jgi:filamentous hemagglutinin